MSDPQTPLISVIERVDELEVRVAHQDETIDSLNKTITSQWQQIDALHREVSRLRDRVAETENKTGDAASSEPPPPHY